MPRKKKTVSLVLGSGGARGIAHIGIIKWLEDNHYEIKSIAGCSIGALIGGTYAAGKMDEYEKWIRAISKLDIVSLLDFSFSIDGLVKGDKIINTLRTLIGDKLIEDLPIPFIAVATDLKREKEVWFNKGSLFEAIRASISIPLFFTPVDHHGSKLIDGGVLNPVPISATLNDRTDITIAVNLDGPQQKLEQHQTTNEIPPAKYLREKISDFIQKISPVKVHQTEQSLGMYYIAYQSIEIMQGTIARQKIAAYPPDILIEIPRNCCSSLEYFRAGEMIELGYKKAEETLSKIDAGIKI